MSVEDMKALMKEADRYTDYKMVRETWGNIMIIGDFTWVVKFAYGDEAWVEYGGIGLEKWEQEMFFKKVIPTLREKIRAGRLIRQIKVGVAIDELEV